MVRQWDSEIVGQRDRGTEGLGSGAVARYPLTAVRLLPAWAVILSESEESRQE